MKICAAIFNPVGGSSAPARTEMRAPSLGFQKRLDPHFAQNPRSAWSDERNQVNTSAPLRRVN